MNVPTAMSNRAPGLARTLTTILPIALLAGFLPVFAVSAADSAPSRIEVPAPEKILATLSPEHPRLLASRADFDRIRRDVVAVPKLAEWWSKMKPEADRLLRTEPAKYEIPDGLRLLGVSRAVLTRSYLLGLAWRITGDRGYADRLARELTAVAAFEDWNPRHFLDTAEMAHAVGVGYDWCFDAFTPEQRGTFRKALVAKALEPARQIHQEAASKSGWPRARHNWNQVCNGGITLGALAIAEDAPDLAAALVAAAVESIRIPMAEFAPDGAWSEGPAYWNYAVIYNVAMLAGLTTALGTDFGLSDMPGFAETGFFPLHLTGPLRRTFNFADGRDGLLRAPQMHWLATRFQRPQFARYARDAAAPHPLDILWHNPRLADEATPPEPLDRHFRGAEIVTLRSGWPANPLRPGSPDPGLFLGFKGGDNKANHSHLDLGSFVFDALGVRWASDPGPENYSVPGYFGAQRWSYAKARAEGHNTLVLNPDAEPDQDPRAAAPILRFESRPNDALAITDLSAAYARHASRVHRGVSLQEGRTRVLIQDEIDADQPVDLFWFFQTSAKIELQGRQATLTQGKARLLATILSPATAEFSDMPNVPLPTSPKTVTGSMFGGHKLAIQLKQASNPRVAVLLTPLAADAPPPPDLEDTPVTALSDWP